MPHNYTGPDGNPISEEELFRRIRERRYRVRQSKGGRPKVVDNVPVDPPGGGRTFTLTITRDGVEDTMTSETATRTGISTGKDGTWYRYWQPCADFDCLIYLQINGNGGCYIITNGYGNDEGGDAGYYDDISITFTNVDDSEETVVIVPEMPGSDVNILSSCMGMTGTFKSWNYQRDLEYPDVRTWLHPQVVSEFSYAIETIGPYKFYPSYDWNGDDGGGNQIGYFSDWIRCSSNGMALSRYRAEATFNRHRCHRLNRSDGSWRTMDHLYTLVRKGQELHGTPGSYTYNTDHLPAEYRNIPDGSCSYEGAMLGGYWSFDGQHIQRALYHWEALSGKDPRYEDVGARLVGDVCEKWAEFKRPGEDAYVNQNPTFENGTNTAYLSFEGYREFLALRPTIRGAPGKGAAYIGREHAHATRIVSKFGSEDQKRYFREFIKEYFRKDSGVTGGGTLGILGFFPETYTIYGMEERPYWPTSIGASATPVNPAIIKAREAQFLGMNLPYLGGCEDEYASFQSEFEPWPLYITRLDSRYVGSTTADASDPSHYGNPYGDVLAVWYSLASGNYHSTNSADRTYGGFTSAAALYTDGTEPGQKIDDNILSQCPYYMWSSAVP